ncbi:type 1 glutamine amidotransferase [Candidatus Peregrinibacteria bacterium]|jgi:GMP synthase (glutamine-hydrolysing)|nr:type 1 glutamine amidotransferase [Candidatus Peregrinibacteria bacterium]MBT4631411.1 type 1 glutamine amidotransferase [Candidatus Peregrinibacteria bacterium]MBT5517098.1 type 1 glutamine amidotransferase [Candidatus Peregrinibacteria bacterium]MBT5824004.1 type 1 glutamine amidotransferase [Candidatus Peregrinibacteria bacterium]
MFKRDKLRILYVQVRTGYTAEHETAAILKYSKLNPEQLITFNALEEKLSENMAEAYDGVFIAGSGEFNVSKGQPAEQMPELLAFIKYTVEHGVPFLGMCYGGQLLAKATGGTLEYAPERAEVKSIRMDKSKEAASDVLYEDMPDSFMANCGRSDDITELKNCVLLASSDLVKNHAFKVIGQPAYGMQFHPELNQKENRERAHWTLTESEYAEKYRGKVDVDAVLASIDRTDHACSLIEKFVTRIVLPLAQERHG